MIYLNLNISVGKTRLNKVKASGGCHDFSDVIFRACSKKIGLKYAMGAFDYAMIKYKIILN